MLNFESTKGVACCDGLTRRDFLRAGALGALGAGAAGLSLADLARLRAAGGDRGEVNCILLFLVGGPSHLDTWDLKPDAPDSVRGPFRPIPTNVPGIQLGEHFPRMAARADRFALIRSVHHHEAPIHETGHQLMQTGRLFAGGQEYPHYGSVVSKVRGRAAGGTPSFVVLPRPIGNTGVSVSHGQGAGNLGAEHAPLFLDAADAAHRAFDAAPPADAATAAGLSRLLTPAAKKALDLGAEKESLRDQYGRDTFGQSCLTARRLVEAGVRLVTVNMFDTVFNQITWDCHADGGALGTTLDDYAQTLCPRLDRAYSALLDDLEQRGLLDNTLVVAMGEFGRTPQINPRGGRDHWPGCWSIALAGGGVRGGQVIGASDATGSEPKDRPVTPAQVAASIYTALGIDLATPVPVADGRTVPLVEAPPVYELFR